MEGDGWREGDGGWKVMGGGRVVEGYEGWKVMEGGGWKVMSSRQHLLTESCRGAFILFPFLCLPPQLT